MATGPWLAFQAKAMVKKPLFIDFVIGQSNCRIDHGDDFATNVDMNVDGDVDVDGDGEVDSDELDKPSFSLSQSNVFFLLFFLGFTIPFITDCAIQLNRDKKLMNHSFYIFIVFFFNW